MPPRATLYHLLSRLYRAAPNAETIATLRGIPGFDEHLPSPAEQEPWLETMAVAHHALFGMTVYPYESLFRHDSLMVNDGTETVSAFYEACGYAPEVSDMGAPDHLALELECLARLDDYANQAMQEGRSSSAAWAEAQRRDFVVHHLAVWVPLFTDALRHAAPPPLYETLATVTQELVLWELSDAGTIPSPFSLLPSGGDHSTGKENGDTAENEGVGLNEIVRTLITPAQVGLWLSRADLRAIARRLQLPVGMGDRHTQLRTLFESAAQFEVLPALFDALNDRWQTAATTYRALQTHYPAWHPIGEAWLARIYEAQALLTEMREQEGKERGTRREARGTAGNAPTGE